MGEASEDLAMTLQWQVVRPEQLWQAACDPYLCTVVRSLDASGGYYATVVRGGDLYLTVLEECATLDIAQAWCADQLWGLGDGR